MKKLSKAIQAIIAMNILIIVPILAGEPTVPWYEKYQFHVLFGVVAFTIILAAVLHFTQLGEFIEEE